MKIDLHLAYINQKNKVRSLYLNVLFIPPIQSGFIPITLEVLEDRSHNPFSLTTFLHLNIHKYNFGVLHQQKHLN
jgi:hypothetical protein